jgi:hypothetical protein
MGEFLLIGIIPRGFVTDKDGFLDLKVNVKAVSRRTGRRLQAKNLSYEKLADCVCDAIDSRLKTGCSLSADVLAGQGSPFLFTSQEVESLGMTPQN